MNKPRVLVVDDEPALSQLVQISLEQTGLYKVLVENQSQRALATALEFRPDVVVLDVNMPGKHGGEVAADIRSAPELDGASILFFTSLLSVQEAALGDASKEAAFFVAKEADPEDLIRTIERALLRPPGANRPRDVAAHADP